MSRFSTKQMGGRGSALADDGTRNVTFTARLFYDQFIQFLWMRTPDNRRLLVAEDRRVEFYDNPNAQVRRRARELGGVWS